LIDACPKCHGRDLTCTCYARYRFELAKVESEIPAKYRFMKLDDIDFPESKKMVGQVEKYIQNLEHYYKKGTGLFLWGGTGTAKTAISCIILKEALKLNFTAYFTDLAKCIDMLCESWNDDEAKQDFIQRILKVDFLVIDDVGREYKPKSNFFEANFDNIFRERSNSLLVTIITSNKSPTEMGSEFGPRLYSIFYEHLIPIEFTSSDYRKKVLSKRIKI
jgi:DNA replication protein DnaC